MDPRIGLAILIVILILRLTLARPKPSDKLAKKKQKNQQYAENTRRLIAELTEESTPITVAPVEKTRIKPAIFDHFELIALDDENSKRSKEIILITRKIPRPHPMFNSLMRDMDNEDELFDVVKSDPEIAAKVLQTVNSAGFYFTEKITRLNQAIFFLGTRLVKNIIMSVTIQGKIKTNDPQQNRAFTRVWAQSFLASSMGALMARHLMLENASELSTQALLLSIGDIGVIAYQADLAKDYNNKTSLVERVDRTQNLLKVNSQVIGGALAKEWELPASLANVIQHNLLPMVIEPAECLLDAKTLKDTVFCYTMARIADCILSNDLTDIKDVRLADQDAAEYYYLFEYLEKTGLDKLMTVFDDKLFLKNANQIIKQMPAVS